MRNSPHLQPGSVMSLQLIHEEMEYFVPQMQTKDNERGLGQLLAFQDHARA